MSRQPAIPRAEPLGAAVPALVRPRVSTVWAAATSPRAVDSAIVADDPDAESWLAALDEHRREDETGEGRLGLHGRIETQVVGGEPVLVVGHDPGGDWAEIRAPWQPTPRNRLGYPGWVRAAHLEQVVDAPTRPQRVDTGDDDVAAVLEHARAHLGLTYLWGGVTPLGFDCSGLVHHAWRRLGLVVPRDAHAQAETAEPVPVDEVRPGDLYFFAHAGRRIHHVGIVTAPGRMVHSSETGGALIEEDLPAERVATLVAAGRLPLSAPRAHRMRGR